MNAMGRRALILVVLLGGLCGAGCDLGSLAYFILPESMAPPKLGAIASEDKKKEVKAMVLVLGEGLDARVDAMQADRELSELLVKHLKEKFQENQEKVTLIPASSVERYKNSHPEWKRENPRKIGELFHVDYVIVVEIHAFSLIEKGNQMFQGKADLTIGLKNVKQEDENPPQEEFPCVYPSTPVDMDSDTTPAQFRQRFLNAIARRLVPYFAAHSQRGMSRMEEE